MVNQGYEGLFREDYWLNWWGYMDHDHSSGGADDGSQADHHWNRKSREVKDLHFTMETNTEGEVKDG